MDNSYRIRADIKIQQIQELQKILFRLTEESIKI